MVLWCFSALGFSIKALCSAAKWTLQEKGFLQVYIYITVKSMNVNRILEYSRVIITVRTVTCDPYTKILKQAYTDSKEV